MGNPGRRGRATASGARDADRKAGPPPAEGAAEALARARQHALRALAEALEAGRALLDAASLASTGAPAASHPLFASADAWIAGHARQLGTDAPLGDPLGPALAEALDAEIERWQRRAGDEEEARAVLRAFLGLRELLWELGVRSPQPRSRPPAPRRRAVERVAVVQG